MAEPPGAQPALGIDAVEWLATGENTVTVVVTGRWRRRAAWRGRPMLVIEVHGRHRRFRAIAEPPSVAGATPGTWRISFSIPAELAPHLGRQAWLQLGAVVVPLPGVVEAGGLEPEAEVPGAPETESPSFEEDAPAVKPAPAGAAEEHARDRGESVLAAAAELSERIQQLEQERREAERRAHAEHARRLELEEQQADLHPQLAAAQSRIRDLERQLAEARGTRWRANLVNEIAVARGAPAASSSAPEFDHGAAALAREQLDRERLVIAGAEADRAAQLERELRDHMLRAELLYEVIDDLRLLLDQIRGLPAPAEDEAVAVVEPVRLDEALARLREDIPPPEAGPASETGRAPGSDGEPSASDATVSAVDAPSVARPTRKSWLLRALRTLAKDDPAAAGRIVLGLLPAERLAYDEPLAYDLLLSDAGCIQATTVRGSATRVADAILPRDLGQIDFRVTGELETLARLLLAGRLRRRFGRRVASVQGDRKALRALTSLVRTPLGLKELYSAGVRLDPPLAFRLAAVMIDRKATASHRFTIAHRGPAGSWYLKISGTAGPSVSDAPPLGPVATTIVSEPGALVAVLAGEEVPGVVVRGVAEPLELIRDWIQRAQSG